MKFLVILVTVTCLSSVKSSDDLVNRAAAQLDRLSAFKRTKESEVEKVPEDEKSTDKNTQNILMNTDAMKRIDELAKAAYNIYKDPNYDAMMQRIKRSGSGDFVSGIANKVIGGVVGSVGGLSSGSSSGSGGAQAHDSYGAPVAPYGAKPFSIFDFKKAILNTVLQALKALAGGALALKGQLIKGGGFVVQTKGRVISSAGEAISSLGSQIASSAVISAPKPVYGPPGYSYDAHHPQDVSYDGPPPSPDATYSDHSVYHHGPYGSPSSDNPAEEPGLLIVKESSPVESPHHEEPRHPLTPQSLQPPTQDDHHQNHINDVHHPPPPEPPGTLEDSFGGPPKGSTVTKFTGVVTGTFQPLQTPQSTGNDNYYAEHKDQGVQGPQQNPSTSSNYQGHQGNDNGQNNQFQEIPAFRPHLGISNDQNINHNYQSQDSSGQPMNYQSQGFNNGQQLNYGNPGHYDFNGQAEPLKVAIFEQHNSLDAVNLGVLGVPNGYGAPPMDLNGHYGAWRRIGGYNRMKKGAYWRYRRNEPEIYRL